MKKEHEILFTPFKIGNVEIKNRIVMPPMGDIPEYDENGVYTENAVEYYVARAKGGVGLIITGCNHVDYTVDDHSGYDHPCSTIKPAHYIRAARELTDRVHSYGAKIFIDFAIFPASASHFQKGRASEDYTTEEMETLVKKTIESAKIAQQAGFDGCEILDCFIHTPSYNRTDKYGGDLRGKLQLQIEIVKGIKETFGEDFAITNRFCLKSFMKGSEHTFAAPGEENFEEFGRDIDEAVEAAKILLEAGYDGFDGMLGDSVSYTWSHPSMYFEPGYPLQYYAKFREKIKAPIICSGRMENPDISAKAISDGIIDFVGVANQQLADPEYVNKIRQNKLEDIRPCIACQQGCMVRWMSEGGFGSCAVNPQCAREKRVPITPALIKKKVVVVGGGPAGLETARVSALRGHEVILFEGGNRLGGVLLVGGQPDFKKEDILLAQWYSRELDKLHVTVKLNTKADKDMIMSLHPDVVVTAEGSHPIKLALPGVDSEKTVFAEDILTNKKVPGDNCVIIGGGLVGCELALDLLNKDKKVAIVEALPDILSAGAPNCLFNEVALRDSLNVKNAEIFTNSKAESINDTGVVITTPDGKKEIKANTVILAVGYRPEQTLYNELSKEDIGLYIAGDSKKARNIKTAIWEGFDIGRAV